MGIHYAQPELAANPPVYRKPAMLTYEPQPNRPYLFGQPFDGPMAGHSPTMPVHYDLHVYLWKHNPSGLFAMWNPTVTCPA